ncbi:hypothetical protein JCGZ_05224 [Jatropha curcas]|uniref:Aminotransferase-like plant mobile domain-containing protein n=1 Tax=Jatropha curcas TaxID=180498 RepID=A0A067L0Z3_JATCU|nr:hypothetical protein JCGZ_05224 [Jatropha curcas]
MTSPGHSSDKDFLESLGISLDPDLAVDAGTHASVTGIYAQDPHIKLDVGETSVSEIPVEIFDHNNPVGAIISPSHLGYLRHFDVGRNSHKELLSALAERCGTYYFWETWAFEYFPYTCPELIQADLGLGLVPLAWRWYRTNLQTVRRRKSLRDLRTFFDTCTVDQVEVGAMTARLQSWIQADPHFQRSDAMSRQRVVLSHPVLRRYYLGERVDFQIRGCRSVPHSPPEDMRAGKQMTLTAAHIEGFPHVEFILGGDYDEFCKMAPRAISEATEPLHPSLANLRLPYNVSYYTPDDTLPFREVSLENVDRLDLPPEDINEVPNGLVSQMMELMLGMQQELSASWTLRAFDDQRRRRPRR